MNLPRILIGLSCGSASVPWQRSSVALPALSGLLLALSVGEAADLPLIAWQGRTMGSDYTVKIVGTNLAPAQLESLKTEVDQRLREVNRQMSHYQPDSELSQFNRAPANAPFKVSPEFARVVRFSLDLARRSQGAFDPTLAPVINLWGFGEKTDLRAVPPAAELAAALKQTGWQHLHVTVKDELVKDLPDLNVNLSAVAKGFGVDEMGRVLRGHGLVNFYASIAGEVVVRGCNPRGTNWQVGISAPLENWREDDPFVAVASLTDRAVSTSGDYQKFFRDAEGRRHSHIFDPRTGWPVQHDVGGVSVLAADSMTADALSTTLFVLGQEAGLKFIEGWTNAAALFIVREPDGNFRRVPSARFPSLTR
jgi:thiamine biosynthesis lipoprotein